MRLQRLTGLEQDKIVGEYKDIMTTIADLLDILARPERITAIISDELLAIKAEFSTSAKDTRRSEIEHNATELDTEDRSEEHTSELQSLMRISYAVFCLKKKTTN